ncbi:hypothetical protein Ahia01_001268500 [Argonauta hians]
MNNDCLPQTFQNTLTPLVPVSANSTRWTKVFLLLLFCLSQLSASSATKSLGRWCQKSIKEEKVQEVVERKKCNKKYNARCGFFSVDTCVFYKTTICVRQYEVNVTVYHKVLDCCPGWTKSDNETCVELSQSSKSLPSIHELSIGTLAAICSANFFVMIILFFIVKAVWKKKRKEKAAAAAAESICLEPLQLVSSNSSQDHQDSTNMNSVHFQPLPETPPSPPLLPPEAPSLISTAKSANPHNLPPSPEICELSVEESEKVPLKQNQPELQTSEEIETLPNELPATKPEMENQVSEQCVDNDDNAHDDHNDNK